MLELPFEGLNKKDADNLESDPHFRSDSEGQGSVTDETPDFKAMLHDKPIAISFKKMLSWERSAKIDRLYERFDLWFVPHRFSAFRESGNSTVSQIQCEINYLSDGETISIISLLPSTEFIDRVSASLGAEGSLNVSINERGNIELDAISATMGLPLAPLSGSINTKGYVKLEGKFNFHVSMRIVTPYITAVGVGSRNCLFQLKLYKDPLYNKDIETWAIVAMPKHSEDLVYRMRCSFTAGRYFVPRVWQSPWTDIRVERGD
jgi:hypothetical protein